MVLKCPYCGKRLNPFEKFCHHCEHDISKFVDKSQQPKVVKPKKGELNKDVENIKAIVKGIKSILSRKKKKTVSKLKRITKTDKIKEKIKGYCVKCKKKVTMDNPKEHIMKNGFLAAKGTCPKCSSKMFRIIKKIK